jgi:hypothetical protein
VVSKSAVFVVDSGMNLGLKPATCFEFFVVLLESTDGRCYSPLKQIMPASNTVASLSFNIIMQFETMRHLVEKAILNKPRETRIKFLQFGVDVQDIINKH